MTYCIGWKTDNAVILAADAALTSDITDKLIFKDGRTSFEEDSVKRDSGKIVEERGLKLFKLKNLIFTYSGLSTAAQAIADTLNDELTRGTACRDAINIALASNISAPYQIAIICAFTENKSITLISFNANGDGKIIEHDDIIQLGSIPEYFKENTADYLKQSYVGGDSAHTKMAKLLGVLQAYGRHYNIMEMGVGGAFSSICLNNNGISWQPDILYLVNFQNKEKNFLVSTCVRYDCFLTVSPMMSVRKCFANVPTTQIRSEETTRKYTWAGDAARHQHDRGKFDYVVLLNGDFPVVIILEMRRKLKHDFLWIKPLVSKDAAALEIRSHPKLVALRGEPLVENGGPIPTVHYIIYIKPRDGNIIKEKIKQRQDAEYMQARGGRIKYTYY